MAKQIVRTEKAPPAIGPYSQGVKVYGSELLFTAGQIPMDPVTGQIVSGDIKVQTRRVLKNLKAVIEAGGSSMDKVAKVTVFLKDMSDFAAMNEVYGEYFGDHPPARSAVQVVRLPKDVGIEIECVAVV